MYSGNMILHQGNCLSWHEHSDAENTARDVPRCAYKAALAAQLIHGLQKLNFSTQSIYSAINLKEFLAGSILEWHIASNMVGQKVGASDHSFHPWEVSHLP
jgi:hypothetical protein